MSATPENPLGQTHYDALNRVLQRSVLLHDLLHKCKSCDMDVSEPHDLVTQQHAKATKLKATFFPNEA